MTNAEMEKLFSVIRESSQKCANTLCEDCKYNHFTGGTQTCIETRVIDAVKENFKVDTEQFELSLNKAMDECKAYGACRDCEHQILGMRCVAERLIDIMNDNKEDKHD